MTQPIPEADWSPQVAGMLADQIAAGVQPRQNTSDPGQIEWDCRPSTHIGGRLSGTTGHQPSHSICPAQVSDVIAERFNWDRTVEAAIKKLPEGLVRGVDLRRPTMMSGNQEISLTLAGAANCDDSGAEVNAVLGLVRVAAAVERDWEPPRGPDQPSMPSIDPETLSGLAFFDPKTLPSPQVLYRASHLAISEPWSSVLGRNHEHLHWTLNFDRRIRPFANVRDLTDYWERRIRVMAPEPSSGQPLPLNHNVFAGTATAQAMGFPATAEVAGSAAAMLASLHPDVEAKAGRLFQDGYLKQAVFEMSNGAVCD
ncbi:hypothetical protein [Streptacidiphilus sp. PAMC 29251]